MKLGGSNIIITLILFRFSCTFIAACRMGQHGNACHLECHCANEAPCNLSNGICPNDTEGGWLVKHCNTTGGCNSNSSHCKGFESCSVEVIGSGSTVSRCRCSKGYSQNYTFFNYSALDGATDSIGANIGAVFGLMRAFPIILIIFITLYCLRKRIAARLRPRHLKPMLLALSLLCLVTLNGLYWKQMNDMSIKSFSFKDYPTRQESMQSNSIDCKTTHSKDSGMTSIPCVDDCIRLRNLLKNWPDGKPKAFVYYLIHSNRVSILLQALNSLDSNFNNVYNYPIVIFHEDFQAINQSLIRSSSKSDIYFQDVKFEIPDFLPRNFTQLSCHWRIGYRHMCRFHAKLVYDQPIICGFEYAWRLDDDSKIKRPIKYDVFEYMREKNLQYGYIAIKVDSPNCTVNLWENTRKYINDSSIAPTFFAEWKQKQMYYNNFEVSRLSLWLSDDYQKFIDYIDKLGGIYYYRWGDAPIKSIAVSLFVRRNETHNFQDIGYQHQKFYRI